MATHTLVRHTIRLENSYSTTSEPAPVHGPFSMDAGLRHIDVGMSRPQGATSPLYPGIPTRSGPSTQEQLCIRRRMNTLPQYRSTNAPAPARMDSILAPSNFAAATDKIYRSGYPKPENYDHIKEINPVKIIILNQDPPPKEYEAFMDSRFIIWRRFDLPQNKHGALPSDEIVDAVLEEIADTGHGEILVHCNGGKHRTGCIIACLKKTVGYSLEDVLLDYERYAGKKSRQGDRDFITSYVGKAEGLF